MNTTPKTATNTIAAGIMTRHGLISAMAADSAIGWTYAGAAGRGCTTGRGRTTVTSSGGLTSVTSSRSSETGSTGSFGTVSATRGAIIEGDASLVCEARDRASDNSPAV